MYKEGYTQKAIWHFFKSSFYEHCQKIVMKTCSSAMYGKMSEFWGGKEFEEKKLNSENKE